MKAFEVGIDPLPTVVARRTVGPLIGSSEAASIKYWATLPPSYIDIRLIDYESNFTPFHQAFVGDADFEAGSAHLYSVERYIRDRGVAIGSPFSFFEVFWTKARLPKFGWEKEFYAPMTPIWQSYLAYIAKNDMLFYSGGVMWEYKTSYINNPKPWDIFRTCTPALADQIISQLPIFVFRRIGEVFPMWVAVRTKAEVTYIVSPFGVKVAERWIQFPHIPPDVVCFYVNAYPLLDGYLVAHIYTGSGVHTYIVDGEKIVKWAFDTVPLHVQDFFKLRR